MLEPRSRIGGRFASSIAAPARAGNLDWLRSYGTAVGIERSPTGLSVARSGGGESSAAM